jgi:hypothetical protein
MRTIQQKVPKILGAKSANGTEIPDRKFSKIWVYLARLSSLISRNCWKILFHWPLEITEIQTGSFGWMENNLPLSPTRAGSRSRFEPWSGSLCCALGQDTLLSQCLSPPRCINGYRRTKCSEYNHVIDYSTSLRGGENAPSSLHANKTVDKRRSDRPLGSNRDLTNHYLGLCGATSSA